MIVYIRIYQYYQSTIRSLLRQAKQLIVLLLGYYAFLESLPQEVDYLAVVRWSSDQYIDLVLPLDDDFEGSDELEGLPVDLERYYLIAALRLQLYVSALSHLERLLHPHLHLPHVQHISQSNHLDHPIAVRLLHKLILRGRLPQLVHSSSPVVNVQQDQILILFDVHLFLVNCHFEVLGKESPILIFQQVQSSDLGVDKLITELGKEQFGVFLSQVVEILTNLRIQSYPNIVIDSKLSMFLSIDCHFPPIQQFLLPENKVLLQQFRRINLFNGSSPAQRSGKVVACAEGNDGSWRVIILPFGDGFDVVHDTADSAVSSRDEQKQVWDFAKYLQFQIATLLLSSPSSRIEITCKGFSILQKAFMKLLPICPPDFLFISTTTIRLLGSHLMLMLFSSSVSFSSLPEILSFLEIWSFFRGRKALVVKLMLEHLISVGSRMNLRRGPKSHSLPQPLQWACLILLHQRQMQLQSPEQISAQSEQLLLAMQLQRRHWWQNLEVLFLATMYLQSGLRSLVYLQILWMMMPHFLHSRISENQPLVSFLQRQQKQKDFCSDNYHLCFDDLNSFRIILSYRLVFDSVSGYRMKMHATTAMNSAITTGIVNII